MINEITQAVGVTDIIDGLSSWINKVSGTRKVMAVSMMSVENRYIYTVRTTNDSYAFIGITMGGEFASHIEVELGYDKTEYTGDTVYISDWEIKILNRELAAMLV